MAKNQTSGEEGQQVVRCHLKVAGLVQGVGFRPYVYRLAIELSLAGWVLNSPSGVTIEVEGAGRAVEAFTRRLKADPPRLARIVTLEEAIVPAAGERSFRIIASLDEGGRRTLVSPDIATCDACREEFLAPGDRRFGHPFINCTDCGPRYSIIRELPYDRPLTSMEPFAMCPQCRSEYDNPADRRFHAQPNACPRCGPRVWLEDAQGREVLGSSWPEPLRRLLKDGAIVAVRGLGGFHLACDANSEAAVIRLRAGKRRPAKPFAVMALDIAAARRYVHIGVEAERLLVSPAAPIVILPVRSLPAGGVASPGKGSARAHRFAPSGDGLDFPAIDLAPPPGVAPSVAPGSSTLGLMLAYAPLHFLLFDDELDLLVMTSANPSGLPIIKDNDEARRLLRSTVDYFLLHDREIVNRCEDSVVRLGERVGMLGGDTAGKSGAALVIPYRRSRGYAPAVVDVSASLPDPVPDPHRSIFGAGGEMKSAFCFLRGGQAFLSPHLGEMDYLESLGAYREAYERYRLLLDSPVKLAGFDPHPGYQVSRLTLRLVGPETVLVPVYHHHAHMASCLADNGLPGDSPVLGLICDGTGYGPDGAIWGFELLAGTAAGFSRLGHLVNTSMPGGDVVARRPLRSAAAHLFRVLGREGVDRLARLRPESGDELRVMLGFLSGTGHDLTSSCGRLYDAVAAMAGIACENTYEGQAAVELTEAGDLGRSGAVEELTVPPPPAYRFSVRVGRAGGRAAGREPILIDPGRFLITLLTGFEREPAIDRRVVSRLFHRALVRAMGEAVRAAAGLTGLSRVCLSGGTFQNSYLLAALRHRLLAAGLEVYTHRQVPPNDGGLALGQAVAAAWSARSRKELSLLVPRCSGTDHQT